MTLKIDAKFLEKLICFFKNEKNWWNCMFGELHVASTFWLGSERPALKKHILWCRTDTYSYNLSAEVSLMLDNPFPVPSLCKLNHISAFFINISTKSSCKQLILFRKNYVFLEVVPGVLGHSVNFNIT